MVYAYPLEQVGDLRRPGCGAEKAEATVQWKEVNLIQSYIIEGW